MPTILEDYIAKHPGSAQRYEESVTIFPGGVTHDSRYATPFPLFMTHGEGPRKWDVDGNEYIDYVSGHGALLLGHSHPAIAEAVSRQIQRGTHLGASTDEELRWARAIKALMPAVEKVRFNSSGTEATLMAMRLARAYTGKTKVIKLQDHFHGWHDYAMAGSDRSAPGIPEASMGTMVIVPPGDLGAVEDVLNRDDDIAALILEPTGAHMGQMPFDTPVYLKGLRELTAKHDVVLIFDEVVTGFRASSGGVQVRYGVSPDLTTMAKIVAGGLPGRRRRRQGRHNRHDCPSWRSAVGQRSPGLPPWNLQRQPPFGCRGCDGPGDGGQPAHQRAGRRHGGPSEGRVERGTGQAGNTRACPRHRIDAPRGAGRLRRGYQQRVAQGNSAGRSLAGHDGNEAGPPKPRCRHYGPRDHPGLGRTQ